MAVWNEEHGYTVELLTNNFRLVASTIAAIYKERWRIEVFFHDIKQLLRVKSLVGTDRNAVETQVWTALANLVVSLRLNTFTKINLEK